jgi:hypothetical protein
MVPWQTAYNRTVKSKDFRLLFGRSFAIDQFNYYAFALLFESLPPALLATATSTPNTGTGGGTLAAIAAPVTGIVPGAPSQKLLNFPKGAIVLGVTTSANLPQRVIADVAFKYAPSHTPGGRDLFLVDMEYVDTADIVGGNPIPQVSQAANSAENSAPPVIAEALMGTGGGDIFPYREFLVTPGLGILTSVSSMVLPNAPADATQQLPNLTVHMVFHCMIPGVVKKQAAA